MADLALAILEDFDARLGVYEDFSTRLRALIQDILSERGVRVHSITARVKARESLQRKLRKPGARYKHLEDLTDLVGVRITTYLADEVDQVAAIIEQEFAVDRVNSVDKREVLDPDQFGYLSLHHVVTLRPERANLTEYRRFPLLKAEIQTRSILQHAWAEIEHDLGYKAGEVPRGIRRRFSRLAGLLELADQEFCSIRNELRDYERAVADQIAAAPQTVALDKASLDSFLVQNDLVHRIDEAIASIGEQEITYEYLLTTSYLRTLVTFGIDTVGDLQRVLAENEAIVVRFAQGWLTDRFAHQEDADDVNLRDDRLPAGISLFYLQYVLAARTKDQSRIKQYLAEAHISDVETHDDLAFRIVAQYEAVMGSA